MVSRSTHRSSSDRRRFAAHPSDGAPSSGCAETPLHPSRLSLGEEADDLAVGRLGLLVVDEVPRTRSGFEGVVGEVVTEPVRPLDLDQGIFLSPQKTRWHFYLWQLRRPVPPDRGPRFVYPDIPVEAALEVTRLHEDVHPGLKILIEEARLVRPMVEEVLYVGFARRVILTDRAGGPPLRVERLVPDLLDAFGLEPAPTYPRVDAVEEEQAQEPLRVLPGEGLGDVGAHVVADQTEALYPEGIHEACKVLHQYLEKGARRVG